LFNLATVRFVVAKYKRITVRCDGYISQVHGNEMGRREAKPR